MLAGIDAHRLAFDTVWEWAERRGVRVDFWRDADEWQVEVTLADSDGDFSGNTTLRLFHPKRSTSQKPKVTQAQMKDDYINGVRAALDAAVTEARERRGRFQQRRLEKGTA